MNDIKRYKRMSCSICTESCSDESYTECGHIFHANCLMKWLEVNDNCPNCRIYHPISKKIIEQSSECACGSCTLFFLPNEINIWIDNNDKTPLCPHCFVDCVFPNMCNFSADKFKEFITTKNNKSFGGKVSLDNEIKIKKDVVVVLNDNIVLTSFYRSRSFDEYLRL